MNWLVISVSIMLLQQTLCYGANLVLPVAAPEIVRDLGLNPALLGPYTTIIYASLTLAGITVGPFIERFGGLRMSQWALLLAAAGLALGAIGLLPFFAMTGLTSGIALALSTPSSSQILARYATATQAPLAFSIKQAGVPLGVVVAGFTVPWLIGLVGWRGAFLVIAVFLALSVIPLQAFRSEFDRERRKEARLSPRDIGKTISYVMTQPDLRVLGLATATYLGIQACFFAFFASYMVHDLGLSLVAAGSVLAIAQAVAAFARIFWGWAAGRVLSPKKMLGLLGIAAGCATAWLGLLRIGAGEGMITVVTILLGATAISWHGIYLAEIARLARPGEAGRITGGMIIYSGSAQMAYPLVFGFLIDQTGGYGAGYVACAMPALAAGCWLFFAPARSSGPPRTRQGGPRLGSDDGPKT